MENIDDSDSTKVYPYCYKIKEDCLPCSSTKNNNENDCILMFSKFLGSRNPDEKKINEEILFDCLKNCGDIYKKLDIELYVNPTTKKILFPNNERIQSNLNIYLKKTGYTENGHDFKTSVEFVNKRDNKISMYNILLIDSLREIYNSFYKRYRIAEPDSIKPKVYGIARISGSSSGGKKTKKYRNKRKTKTNKFRR